MSATSRHDLRLHPHTEHPISTLPPKDPLPDLLARCALGDREAFARLYRAAAAKLFGVAVRILNDGRAEEVVQKAFVKIWHHAGDYRPEKGTAMTWMASIVRNRALDLLRRGPIRTPPLTRLWTGKTSSQGPLNLTLRSAEARALSECLNSLSRANARP